jgi:2-dehydropantoate 2-reductase
MRNCILGCGGIGSIFAAGLARVDTLEVFACDVWNEHVKAINEDGLRVIGEANFTVEIEATTDPMKIPRCDYGIVAARGMDTRDAIAGAAHLFDEKSAVCSIQNGVGNEEILAEYVPHVIRGTTFAAGHVAEPGHVTYEIAGETWLGPFEPAHTPMKKVEGLAATLTRAGLETIAVEDARGVQWTKLIFTSSTFPVEALTLLHHRATTSFRPTHELLNLLIEEGGAVARALGIDLHHDPKDAVRARAQAPGKHQTSMMQDVLAGRATEIDFMNGAIVRCGEQAGVPTPLNRTLWALIKGLEHSWTHP